MAGIEKLCGNKAQYTELVEWLKKNDIDCVLDRVRDEWDDEYKYNSIANFSYAQDCFLYDHCPFKWVTDRISEQYDGNPSKDLK